MTAADPRVVLPVDPQGEELLVFHPQRFDMITGWAVVWSRGQLFVRHEGESKANGAIIRLRFGLENEHGDPDVTEDVAGRQLVIRELYVTAGQAVTGRYLQKVALSRYEAAVNTPAARTLLDPLMAAGNLVSWPWPDDRLSDDDDRPWYVVPPPKRASRPIDPPQLRLDVPKGYGRPDSFYAKVAELYAYLSRVSLRPANELAEANDVPVTTVHGWVKEARKRGLLPARQSRKGDNR